MSEKNFDKILQPKFLKLNIIMKNTGIIILTTLALFQNSGCKKGFEQTYLPDGAIKYYGYREGTYWIYHNNITNMEDSFFVSFSEQKLVTETTYGFKTQNYDLGFKAHIQDSLTASYTLHLDSWSTSNTVGSNVFTSSLSGSNNPLPCFSDYGSLAGYPIYLKNTRYNDQYFEGVRFVGDTTVAGNAYSQVIHITNEQNSKSSNPAISDLYYTPDAGFLIIRYHSQVPNGCSETDRVLVRKFILKK